MDIAALQLRVRQFAAERNWQAFHTPKNLSTALFVEAAELAEIFQWMTGDESSRAASDPGQREHIGAEVADVLLYLLQLADHCGVDVEQAVEAKIVANARKYPGPRAAALKRVGVQPGSPAVHVLIDYENVQPTLGEIEAAAPGASSVWVFHGPHQKHVDQAYPAYGDRVTVVPISKTGKNALDFHLSYYLGYLASRNDQAVIVVMANDTGYEPMLMHARAMGIQVHCVPVPRPARRTTTTARKSAGQRVSPLGVAEPGPVAAKQVAARSTTSKTIASKKPAAQMPASPPRKAAVKKAASKTVVVKQAAGKTVAAKQLATAKATGAPSKVAAGKSAPAKKAATSKTAPKQVAIKIGTAVPAAAVKKVAAKSVAKPAGKKSAAAPPPPKVSVDSMPAPATSAVVTPVLLQHAIDSLRKMDDKRPVRLSGLRGALKSLLGAAANAQTIDVTIQRLVEQGYLDLGRAPKLGFPKFEPAKAARG
jgi:NTP pyrophosphatase (non-canonical NTP hydrolase)